MRTVWFATASFVCSAMVFAQTRPATARGSELQKAADEFRVQTRNLGYRADSPVSTTAQASANVRYHGRLYENFRNDFLDAAPHELVQRGQDKNLLRRNQFGFNLAGPVRIPGLFNGGRRTFFSVSYEGVRERISRSSLRTVATDAERTGDFSNTVDLAGEPLPVFDPATTRANPDYNASQPVTLDNLQYVRQPFPGNRIPASRLDPTAQAALTHYPQANTAAGPFFQNNFLSVNPESNTANGVIAKVDHSATERHRFEFSTAVSNGFAGTARLYPTIADPNPADRAFRSRRGGIDHTWTVSARTVNTIEIAAASDSTRNDGDIFPNYRLGSYAPMGRSNPGYWSTRNTFGVSNGWATRHRGHSIRLSGGFSHQQLHSFTEPFPVGSFRFGTGLTSMPGITNTGHSFASFLLGLADQAERSVVASPSYFRRNRINFAGRDTWEIRRGLLVTGSLNFEVNTPRVEKYDRQSTVNLAAINPANGRPGALVVAGQNGEGRAFQPVLCAWEPAVSASWQPQANGHTVLRGSWSLGVGAFGLSAGQWATQAFNAYPTYISSNVQLEPALTLAGGLPPTPALPDTRPEALNGTVADLMDRTGRQPMTTAAGASVEQRLPGDLTVTAGVYRHEGKDMLVGNTGANVNGIPLDELVHRDRLNEESFRTSLRPYPQYVGFDLNGQYPIGRYKRDAGYLRMEKRTAGGLGLSAYYEWGKQLDDYSGPYGVQDPVNRDNEWSLTAGRPPRMFSLTYVYELPIGPGKPLLGWTDWRRYVVEGWSLSGVTSVNSGDPLYLRPQFNNTGGVVDALNVNVMPGVTPGVADPGPDGWFNPAAFAQPPDFTAGNASRTHPSLLMPGAQNHDLSVTKRFTLDADRTVELSAAGFNFVNHANWNDPDTVIGTVSSPNVNAGKIIGSRGGRVVQLGLRYSF